MSDQATLSSNPTQCLNYEFGMLLGREDFVVEQGYHRGKVRLHNAWLHREGVIWGYGIDLKAEADEIVVRRGLAIGPAGHELLLTSDVCVNVPLWLETHRNDPGFTITKDEENPAIEVFDAHVTLAPSACLSRPVPSISQSCGDPGSTSGVAYSRILEVVDIRLVPGLPKNTLAPPFRRLRLLFGLEEPLEDPESNQIPAADQEVIDARQAVFAQPDSQQPRAWLAAIRRFAALDSSAMEPWSDPATGEAALTPQPENAAIVLAVITGIRVDGGTGGAGLTAAAIDISNRPTHIPTRTLSDLLAGPARGTESASTQGPHVVPSSVASTDAGTIAFAFDADVEEASVSADSVWVNMLGAGGWSEATVTTEYDPPTRTVTASVAPPLADDELIRLTVRGTGATPVIGSNGFPLAGSADAADGSAHDGKDFVWMFRRTSA